jgi:hypothetical protein
MFRCVGQVGGGPLMSNVRPQEATAVSNDSSPQNPEQRARKVLAAMTLADVRSLIDADRLVRSAVFAEIVDAGVAHASDHGDFHYLNQLLSLLQGTKHQSALVEWLSTRLSVSVHVRGGFTALRKGTNAAGTVPPLEAKFPSTVAARKRGQDEALLQAKLNDPRLRVVVASSKGYVDMLDSRARLPGSFGSGKRR